MTIFVGVLLVAIKHQPDEVNDESNICKFFRKRSGCWRGERCPFRHVVPQQGTYTQDRVKVYVDSENELSITLPEEGSWVGVEIRVIYSPQFFYINLPWGSRYPWEASPLNQDSLDNDGNSEMDLTHLVHSMTTHYDSLQFRGNKMLLPAIGEIVAARFTNDDKWYRAKVIFSEDENNVKVFYLDFGNVEVLAMAHIHPIEPQFLQLPFQAIECTLNGVEPASGQSFWTDDAVRCFSNLVLEKSLIAFVCKRSVDMTRLELNLFDPSKNHESIVKALCSAGYAQPMFRNKETKS